ncbi:LysR family transcriptional regulator [Sporolactobacillus kofuensis]|uniref:LysR family transcriptional regulator n=1 Tax=Sporolactobacillus kofuensis TaxID=269672 RepID=A0ABW1WHV2_9BACL|nr:LysR family transcriptional regulator [Sporolactobacillus kofuensis]MCO7176671.1 LysR family transcriptional regulator [Sporolactobacillus kofuensis]
MSLIKYQILVKVVDVSSFTKAADQLGLTQSAVSHAVTSLENTFGFLLINRDRSGITLTREGESLLPSIRAILRMDDKIHQEASALLGVASGTVSVGVFTSVSKHLLPQIIQRMDKKYPFIKIRLSEGNYKEIEDGLSSGELDCGFINKRSFKPFDVTPLKKDRMLCIVSSESSLYDASDVSFRQIENESFIMPAFGGYHEVKRLLAEHHCRPNVRFELMEENAILAMITHHLGISILPEMVLPEDISPLKAIPLISNSYRSISLATRNPPSPAAKAFTDVTKEVIIDFES